MNTLELTEEEIEEMDLPYCDGAELIYDGEWRWGNEFNCVFEYDGKHWMAPYRDSSGDSELDLEDQWYGFPVKAVEVEQRARTIMEWVKVDA